MRDVLDVRDLTDEEYDEQVQKTLEAVGVEEMRGEVMKDKKMEEFLRFTEGVRSDFHEPVEQGIRLVGVVGTQLTVQWEYKLWDTDDEPMSVTRALEATEEEKSKGVIGLLLWNARIRQANSEILNSYIKSWARKGDGRPVTLVDMCMGFKDGYFEYTGSFPVEDHR